MFDIVKVYLTDEQNEQLQGLRRRVWDEYRNGRPGLLLGQASDRELAGLGYVRFFFLPYEPGLKLQAAMKEHLRVCADNPSPGKDADR